MKIQALFFLSALILLPSCKDDEEVDLTIYTTCPNDHHPHIIDLGIGTKWACCNIGASSPEDFGDYYAWAETNTKTDYSEVTYQYAEGKDVDGDGFYDRTDTDGDGLYDDCAYLINDKFIFGTENDVAHEKWGHSWQMPIRGVLENLWGNCEKTWTTRNGVKGMLFTGPNGGSIFLPAAGHYWRGSNDSEGARGVYWSSECVDNGPLGLSNDAYILTFSIDYSNIHASSYYYGYSVRAIWQ